MNFKPLYIFFKRFTERLMILLAFLLFITHVHAQSNQSGYSDVARQRLLIHIIAHYLHTVSQGQIDMDSAVRIPCKVYGLSPLLAYNEGYNDGKPTAGSRFLDAGKVKKAEALVNGLRDEVKLQLLLDLGNYFVFKPGNEKPDINEASKFTAEAMMLSKGMAVKWQIESMILQGHLLDQSGLTNESQKMFAAVVMLAKRSGNWLACARALLCEGELLSYGDPQRLVYFEKALSIFESRHAKEKIIETLSEINVEYFINKRYDIAQQITLRIIKLQTEINFRQQQYAYDALGYMFIMTGNLADAVSSSNKSFESLSSRADSVFISLFFERRGILFEYVGKKYDALACYNKALENKKNETRLYWYNAFLGKLGILNDIGKYNEALSVIKEIGNRFPPINYFEKMHFVYMQGRIYEHLKKNNPAEKNYKTFLTMAGKFPLEYVNSEFPSAFFYVGNFYRTIGKTSKARKILQQGKSFTSNFDPVRMGFYYYCLFEVDSTDKRYVDAIKDRELSDKLTDLGSTSNERKKVNELLVKYETDKKDKNIKLLHSQNQLVHIRLEEDERTKNIVLGGIVLLLIICALLLNSYLSKQRSNKALEVNQIKLESNQRELDQKNIFLETLNTEQNKLLKEKEWLIKEVHHRVKNNLQMVTSLLYSQTFYLEDHKAVLAVKDSLRRIQAMALIHQKLYQDENTSTIAMPDYLNDLASYLNESFDAGNRITFTQNIEHLELDVSQAIPLGLIVTESIVNAIKYAFLKEQKGVVSIDLRHDGPDYLLLKISDNGIGLPEEFDTLESNSLGLDLMQGLAKQLGGNFNIESNNGVLITVRFMVS